MTAINASWTDWLCGDEISCIMNTCSSDNTSTSTTSAHCPYSDKGHNLCEYCTECKKCFGYDCACQCKQNRCGLGVNVSAQKRLRRQGKEAVLKQVLMPYKEGRWKRRRQVLMVRVLLFHYPHLKPLPDPRQNTLPSEAAEADVKIIRNEFPLMTRPSELLSQLSSLQIKLPQKKNQGRWRLVYWWTWIEIAITCHRCFDNSR